MKDLLTSAFMWYGPQTRAIEKGFGISPLDQNTIWVQLPEYGIAWNRAGSLQHLATALNELKACGNPHYYFTAGTPLAPGEVALDIGACEGAFALECLKRFGAERVYCFEPDIRMAQTLSMTAERNDLANRLVVVPVAVSDRSGTVLFIEDPDNVLMSYVATEERGGNGLQEKVVEQVSLDEWAEREQIDRIDYLKIDAEGSDLNILLGAKDILLRCRPKIAVTTYHDPGHAEAIYQFLESLNVGYRMKVKGIVVFYGEARPVMLHAVCPK